MLCVLSCSHRHNRHNRQDELRAFLHGLMVRTGANAAPGNAILSCKLKAVRAGLLRSVLFRQMASFQAQGDGVRKPARSAPPRAGWRVGSPCRLVCPSVSPLSTRVLDRAYPAPAPLHGVSGLWVNLVVLLHALHARQPLYWVTSTALGSSWRSQLFAPRPASPSPARPPWAARALRWRWASRPAPPTSTTPSSS
jgi:hypothetical protein